MRSIPDKERCQNRLDRVAVTVRDIPSRGLPDVNGFSVIQDVRVRPQGAIPTYARVRRYEGTTSACRMSIQYKPQSPWLPAARITVVGDDQTGVTPEQSMEISVVWPAHEVSIAELTFDFRPDTPVDESYVLRHGRFGKSRRKTDRGGPGCLRYGSRGSAKLVRCYWKKEIERYRVELELHSAFLKKHAIRKIVELPLIATKLWPNHISFKVVRWEALESHLVRRHGSPEGTRLCQKARESAASLHQLTRFLSGTVHNPHRFWGSAVTNRDIRDALQRWATWFGLDEEMFRATK